MVEEVSAGRSPAVKRLPRLRGFLRLFRRDERGQALVEFALVFLPLALIILGGIDFGFVFKDFISVRQGVSDTARFAAVGQFGTNSTCTLAGVSGASTATKELMCNAHSLDGFGSSDDNDTRIAIAVGDSSHQSSGGYAQGQPIVICEQYKLHSTTGIIPFINGKVATSTATDMIETVNTTSSPATTAETPFSGTWPTECTSGPAPAS